MVVMEVAMLVIAVLAVAVAVVIVVVVVVVVVVSSVNILLFRPGAGVRMGVGVNSFFSTTKSTLPTTNAATTCAMTVMTIAGLWPDYGQPIVRPLPGNCPAIVRP